MKDDVLVSSDSVRSAAPLRYAQTVAFEQPFALELGGTLPGVTVTYETYGTLNAAQDNAVLICHALSGDSHVTRHTPDDEPGWWDSAPMVGPGRPIDTDRYFVICPNILGGCRGTTGPNSVNPATGRPYGPDFPTITVGDMVEVQRKLVKHLGIRKLLAVIGGSLGGHQVLAWATRFPDMVRSAVAIATSPRLTSQALAFDVVGRNAILSDRNFHGGRYAERGTRPTTGLAIARMLGHITYLSREAMMRKFEADRLRPRDVATAFEKKFSVGSYLAYQGDRFVERFDANSYITLSLAMDLFDLVSQGHASPASDESSSDPERQRQSELQALTKVLGATTCRWLVIAFSSDWLFPPFQSCQIVNALLAADRPVTFCNVSSACGHDAFLLPDDLDRYGSLVRSFLEHSATGGSPAPPTAEEIADLDDDVNGNPRSIFHRKRLDYDLIVDLIPPQASVLDLGCGSGGLSLRLKRRGQKRVVGVELDERKIVACATRGLDVIHADLNYRLPAFADGQFDVVVLSQMLQSIVNTQGIIAEILRIGRRSIVSFPNFAYRKLRQMLAEDGRAPQSGLLHYQWYSTPNRRFFSIKDFQQFCAEQGIHVHQEIYLDTEAGRQVAEDPNLNADMAIFVISR